MKKNFEIINKFADYTIAKLRYGDSFIGCQIDYGTNFFLKNINDLHKDFELAKKAGVGESILEQIQINILDTKYKEDHRSRERAKIIMDLDPLPQKNDDEAIKILENGGIDKINFIIKSNLINFVKRFERENINLVEFASNRDYSTKIDTILTKLKDYASEFRQDDPDQGE